MTKLILAKHLRFITDVPPTKHSQVVTEIHCLPFGTKARNRILATGITTIAAFSELPDQEVDAIRQTGPVTLRTIRTVLKEFCLRVMAEAVKNPGQPVVISLQDEIKAAAASGKTPHRIEQIYGVWPKITKRIISPPKAGEKANPLPDGRLGPKKPARNRRVIELVANGKSYDKAAKIVAQEFGEPKPISRQAISEIVKRWKKQSR